FDIEALRLNFSEYYLSDPRIFCAPGRVNLIGEHTDYNDGFVLPVAIDRATFIAGSRRRDRLVRVISANIGEEYEFDLDNPDELPRGDWTDYVEGVARILESYGNRLSGANLLIESNIPVGAGLSSSAALEIATGFALLKLADLPIDDLTLAQAGQLTEHQYIGSKCGIMDQLISLIGRDDHAMLIDCRSHESRPVPLNLNNSVLNNSVIVICDSHVKHELRNSAYNMRREECSRAVELLKAQQVRIESLRDASDLISEGGYALNDFTSLLPDPINKRCRHVLTENRRTTDAADLLKGGRLKEFGKLMIESHSSMRDDYEISCAEMDFLVSTAIIIDGVYGARMTGGGFGGCTVNLVERDALDRFRQSISREYHKQFGQTPTIYEIKATDGAREVRC
ncbi:MAG: galactokinase, partial [Pyrinomonadaceae bacterium]